MNPILTKAQHELDNGFVIAAIRVIRAEINCSIKAAKLLVDYYREHKSWPTKAALDAWHNKIYPNSFNFIELEIYNLLEDRLKFKSLFTLNDINGVTYSFSNLTEKAAREINAILNNPGNFISRGNYS